VETAHYDAHDLEYRLQIPPFQPAKRSKTAELQTVYSAKQYTYFTSAFFTFIMLTRLLGLKKAARKRPGVALGVQDV
jgi:hypothetical protein